MTSKDQSKLSDKLETALASNESNVADSDSFKMGFVEGFLKGKDEPKKSDRLKNWTTVLIIGVLVYLYFKMVSVFGKYSLSDMSRSFTENIVLNLHQKKYLFIIFFNLFCKNIL